MVNINTDAKNGNSVNVPGPTTQLKTHHPNANAATTPPIPATTPAIAERTQTDDLISAKDIGAAATITPNLNAK
jgi:hypothetical protein